MSLALGLRAFGLRPKKKKEDQRVAIYTSTKPTAAGFYWISTPGGDYPIVVDQLGNMALITAPAFLPTAGQFVPGDAKFSGKMSAPVDVVGGGGVGVADVGR